MCSSCRPRCLAPSLLAACKLNHGCLPTCTRRGTRSLTVAVESGSERVRGIVNKKLGQDEIVRCAQAAQVRAPGGRALVAGSWAVLH